MKRVFVSYSRRNKAFAERIARDLSDAGLDVWVDFRQIQGGELWQNEIYRGIERSEIVVFCMSPDSITSEWCRKEAHAARDQGKYIVPVMVVNAMDALSKQDDMRWLLDVHFINFEGRYEAAFPELLLALPGGRRISVYDDVPPENIPNPFKGLEAFQQTDAAFFFGREELIAKSLRRLKDESRARFIAVVGASGSGKSSLVRAGVIPKVRDGALPGSETWPVVIFTPGAQPLEALITRLLPLWSSLDPDKTQGEWTPATLYTALQKQPESIIELTESILEPSAPTHRLLLVVDQFEEVFTQAGETEREIFLQILHHAVTAPGGRALVIVTMRADFFGQLSRYPALAELFEQENMIIATEMTSENLLRCIVGPAEAVGLQYDPGLSERILEEVRRQPGSLPLLQYALKELYEKRDGRRLTSAAYEQIGGVRRALARHAETIYTGLNITQQAIFQRVMLRLVEVGASGEATRRRVSRADLTFKGLPNEAVQEVIDLLTAAESRLLIASREIKSNVDEQTQPLVWVEVSHEALIREWERLKGWIADNAESLRFGSQLLKAASDWRQGNSHEDYLLTGSRLLQAEIWIETADATDLQRHFVAASIEQRKRLESLQIEQQARELQLQRQAARRLRYFVAVLVVSLLGAVALTLLAVESSARADEAARRERASADIANRNAAEAQSLALAASAERALSDENVDLALALAVQSVQIDNVPVQAQFTLARAAYTPWVRQRIENAHQQGIRITLVSPSGQYGLSGGGDMTVALWDLATNALIRRYEGLTAAVRSLAISPDERVIAAGTNDNLIVLWDAESGAVRFTLTTHTAPVSALAFSPDGALLASGDESGLLVVWNSRTGTEIQSLTGHENALVTAAFVDNNNLLSASSDNHVIEWQARTGEIVLALKLSGERERSPVLRAGVFDSAGQNILFALSDGSVNLFNLAEQRLLQTFTIASTDDSFAALNTVHAVALSPDGATAAAALDEGRIVAWDLQTGAEILDFRPGSGIQSSAHTGAVLSAAFSPNSQRLFSGGEDNILILWDVVRAEETLRFERQRTSVQTVAFSPDGSTVLSGSAVSNENPVGDLRSWDITTGRIIQQFVGHETRISSVAYTPDGSAILAGDSGGMLLLWDSASAQVIRAFKSSGNVAHASTIYALDFTEDGLRAISASRDKTLILWDVATGTMIGEPYVGHTGSVFAVDISPDGRLAVSGGADAQIIVWDLTTGQAVNTFAKHDKAVRTVRFNADGTQVISGASDGTLVLWDTQTGNTVLTFSGHRSAVNSVDFSPDNRSILSGSLDGTISLWDIATGFELRRYQVFGAGVLSLDFSPDGATVVSGLTGTDYAFRLWRVLPTVKQVLDWVFTNRLVPELSCALRVQFRVTPACAPDGVVPTSTPYPLPTATLESSVPRLAVGGAARVNTTLGDTLNLRENPGLRARILNRLQRGVVVTLLEGPVFSEGLLWWRVETEDKLTGWVVESVNNIQTLLPSG